MVQEAADGERDAEALHGMSEEAEIMGRSHRQSGWLRAEHGSWLGSWRTYTGQKSFLRRSTKLGPAESLTREQAQRILTAMIEEDHQQYGIVRNLNAATKARESSPMNGSIPIHPGHIGSAAEMLVAADLTMRGYDVYRAVSPTAASDLIFCDETGARVRVEVKSVEYRKERSPRVNVSRNAGKFDVLAAVDSKGQIHYRTHNGIGKTVIFFSENSDLQSAFTEIQSA